MGTVRSIHGNRRQGYSAQLMVREPGYEVRQIYAPDGTQAGDLIALYTPTVVRGVVLLRSIPTGPEWETLDAWVLAQLDNYERRYVIDYYEARYTLGVEGPPERPAGEEEDE